jgi:hypothetical protein
MAAGLAFGGGKFGVAATHIDGEGRCGPSDEPSRRMTRTGCHNNSARIVRRSNPEQRVLRVYLTIVHNP